MRLSGNAFIELKRILAESNDGEVTSMSDAEIEELGIALLTLTSVVVKHNVISES